MTRTTIVLCCAFDKKTEVYLAVAIFGIIGAALGGVIAFQFLFGPLIKFDGYEYMSCYVNTSTVEVFCNDRLEQDCYFTAGIKLGEHSSKYNYSARYPVAGEPLSYVMSKVSSVNYTFSGARCYGRDIEHEPIYFDNNSVNFSERTLYYGIISSIFCVTGLVLFIIFLIKSVRPAYSNYQNIQMGGYTLFKSINDDNDGDEGSILRAMMGDRLQFIRRTYSILCSQLSLTFAIVAIFTLYKPAKFFIQQNWWMMFVGVGAMFVFMIPLFLLKDKKPWNFIFLFLFTTGCSLMIAFVCSFFEIIIVIQAAFATLTIFVSLTAYTMQTRFDFSFIAAGLYSIFACMFIFLICFFIYPYFYFYQMAIAVLGAMIFCLIIICDTAIIMETLKPGDEIMAAVKLYLDIINLFLRILYIFAAQRK